MIRLRMEDAILHKEERSNDNGCMILWPTWTEYALVGHPLTIPLRPFYNPLDPQ
jgi:hypothetical protein